jgi:hypothetical protein
MPNQDHAQTKIMPKPRSCPKLTHNGLATLVKNTGTARNIKKQMC